MRGLMIRLHYSQIARQSYIKTASGRKFPLAVLFSHRFLGLRVRGHFLCLMPSGRHAIASPTLPMQRLENSLNPAVAYSRRGPGIGWLPRCPPSWVRPGI